MGGIFVSYRRQDSADASGRIYEHLVARYGKAAVFKDVDGIPYGEDFALFLQGKLRECSIVLALIGPRSANSSRESPAARQWRRKSSPKLVIARSS